MTIKKLTALILVFALLLALTACGSGAASAAVSSAEGETAESAADTAAAPAEEAGAEEAPAEETAAEDASAVEAEEPEETAAEPFVYELPLVDETTTISILSQSAPPFITPLLGEEQSYNTAESTKYLAELTGIKIEYHEVDMFSYAEQLSLMAASGDFTDLISSVDNYYNGGINKAYADDVILDLTEYVENDMPVLKALIEEKGLQKELMNDEGQYLEIRSFNDDVVIDSGGIIRKDYLDQLGLDIPETYDELYEAGKAIMNKFDCDFAFLFEGKINPGLPLSDGYDLPGFDITKAGSSFYQVDGKVQCAYVTDNMKEYISMLADWCKEGLISPDFFNYTASTIRNVYEGGQCAVCWDGADALTTYNANDVLQATGFDAAPMPHIRKEAEQIMHFTPKIDSTLISGTVCLSKNCEDVDLTIQLLDFMFTREGQLLSNYGVEGASYELDENGEPHWTEAMYPTAERSFLQTSSTYLLNSIPSVKFTHANDAMTYDEEALSAIEMWKQDFDGAYDYPTHLTLTVEESEEYSSLVTDLDTYISEYLLKCVTGGVDIDATWDSYVKDLENMGLEDCIRIQQAALDRYNAR